MNTVDRQSAARAACPTMSVSRVVSAVQSHRHAMRMAAVDASVVEHLRDDGVSWNVDRISRERVGHSVGAVESSASGRVAYEGRSHGRGTLEDVSNVDRQNRYHERYRLHSPFEVPESNGSVFVPTTSAVRSEPRTAHRRHGRTAHRHRRGLLHRSRVAACVGSAATTGCHQFRRDALGVARRPQTVNGTVRDV